MGLRTLRLRWRLEPQREGVHAVALAGGQRAVVEDVAEMAGAAAAMDFVPGGEERVVLAKADGARERFVDNPAADALLTREYRKPFVVPSETEL